MNFFAPMARYPSGELVGLGATRSPVRNRGTRPKSYDRCGEPSGGLAGTALRVAGLRKLPGHASMFLKKGLRACP